MSRQPPPVGYRPRYPELAVSVLLTFYKWAPTLLQNICRSSVTAKTDLLQGTLDLLILRALLLQPDHGVGITRRIQQVTRGTFDVKPGSLFPALHRLEERGWLASQWGESENRRRAKYYKLTAAGRRNVDAELTNWQHIVTAIGWAIKATS